MSENIQCPYGESCPSTINNSNEIARLNERMELQNKYIIEKIDNIASDVKEVKQSLGADLDKRIDDRIEAKLNEKTAKMTRWVIGAILGSGGLSTLLTLLLK